MKKNEKFCYVVVLSLVILGLSLGLTGCFLFRLPSLTLLELPILSNYFPLCGEGTNAILNVPKNPGNYTLTCNNQCMEMSAEDFESAFQEGIRESLGALGYGFGNIVKIDVGGFYISDVYLISKDEATLSLLKDVNITVTIGTTVLTYSNPQLVSLGDLPEDVDETFLTDEEEIPALVFKHAPVDLLQIIKNTSQLCIDVMVNLNNDGSDIDIPIVLLSAFQLKVKVSI